ncbi:restriction endonuclease subunit S [Nocardiopsis ganjiahuensis]|uniref:restriction endonuclease subunit S n=1 Tax=Nocardiopsis ganjiahuensis TaxID=239984 RepID=UPI001955390B|nr:restriction endonuclease subunit S [Nocardiopsis ganjiahuensis]
MTSFFASIPEGWRASPLKLVTNFLGRGSAPDYVDDGPVHVVNQAVNRGSHLDWAKGKFHGTSLDPGKIKGFLENSDVIINSTGTGTLGRVGFFEGSQDGRPAIADGHVTVVRARKSEMLARYAYYVLGSSHFYDFMYSSMVVGSTNQIELSRERLASTVIPLPPLEEQRRIADFLDAEVGRTDTLVKARRKGIKTLLERRVANVFHQVSGSGSGALGASMLPWLDRTPKAWQEVRLGLLARMGSGHTPSRSNSEWWKDCSIPWITTGEVSQIRDDRREEIHETRECISELGLENSAAEIHPKGTVVLCRTASAGYSAVMGTDMATSQDFVTWTCGPRLDPYYLLWCLRAMRSDLLGRLAMGSTHKTIYVPDLQMLRIPLPGIDEQRKIVKRIREANERIDRAADAVQRQIDLLEERKRALITAAVTGRIDVPTVRGADVS